MRWWSRFVVGAVLLSLVTTACADAGTIGAQGRPSPGPGAHFISSLMADAVVDATVLVVDEVPATEVFAGYPRVVFRVDRVRWESRWDPATLNERFPAAPVEAGRRLWALGNPELGAIGQLEPGGDYVLFLGYTYHTQTDPFWDLLLAVHPDGRLLPAYDLDGARKVLDAIVLPGETDVVEALIDYNAADLREHLGGAPPQSSPRTARVEELYRRASEERTGGASAQQPPDAVWRATPPRERYLPADPVDVPLWLDDALGEPVIPYELLVLHDDALDDAELISLFVQDAGLLGLHVVDHTTGITAIAGMAPPGRALELVAWNHDPEGFTAASQHTVASFPGLTPADPEGKEITAIVDLRGDRPKLRVVTRAAFDETILRLEPLLTREAPDPRDPSPGS